MNTRRSIPIFAILLLAFTGVFTGCSPESHRTLTKPESAERLSAAVRGFSHDQAVNGKPLPESVTFGELVAGRYMATNDVTPFGGMEEKVSLSTNALIPGSVLIHVRMADGSQYAAVVSPHPK